MHPPRGRARASGGQPGVNFLLTGILSSSLFLSLSLSLSLSLYDSDRKKKDRKKDKKEKKVSALFVLLL
jgi:hypothetical protein